MAQILGVLLFTIIVCVTHNEAQESACRNTCLLKMRTDMTKENARAWCSSKTSNPYGCLQCADMVSKMICDIQCNNPTTPQQSAQEDESSGQVGVKVGVEIPKFSLDISW